MQTYDFGDDYLLWPTLHAVNGPEDTRPTAEMKKCEVRELGVDFKKIPFEPSENSSVQYLLYEQEEEMHPYARGKTVSDIVGFYFTKEVMKQICDFASSAKPRIADSALSADGAVPFLDVHPHFRLNRYDVRDIQKGVRHFWPHLIARRVFGDDSRDTRIRFRVLSERQREVLEAKYTYFTLRTENVDYQRAVHCIAKALHVPRSSLTCAEVKDDCAVTYRRMCGRNIDKPKLIERFGGIIGRGIQVADLSKAKKPISPSNFAGNSFKVKICDIGGLNEAQVATLRAISHHGFINYYGAERFGSSTCPWHMIGLYALRKAFASALALFFIHLAEKSDIFRRCAGELILDDFSANTAYHYALALDLCPRSHQIEREMLQVLTNDPKSYKEAWECVPEESRTGYYEAVQCYVWNRMVTKRLALFGRSLVVGDLVSPINESLFFKTDRKDYFYSDKPPDARVHVIMDYNIALFNEHNAINDLFMPLVGSESRLKYPTHASFGEEAYLEELKRLGAEDLRSMNIRGGYRRVFYQSFVPWSGDPSSGGFPIGCDLPKGCHVNAVLREIVRVCEGH